MIHWATTLLVQALTTLSVQAQVRYTTEDKKAIKAYENRGPTLRHGIALDRQVTIILSQTDHEKPLCGIYFNLHSPYQKKAATKPAGKPVS